MKKITYLLLFLLTLASCKFDPNPYSFNREFDGGTYITSEGIVKYISGAPDSALNVSDNYAIIREEITYIRKDGSGNIADSILLYGHCYSLTPVAVASPAGLPITYERLDSLSYIMNSNGEQAKPTEFVGSDKLDVGKTFESTFGLHYETDYYIKSFVVTGYFDGSGEPVYEHIAYNQNELKITTKKPVDLWVGGTMQEAPDFFTGGDIKGAISFTYNGYMFVALGHNQSELLSSITLYRYDPSKPKNEQWDTPYDDYPISNVKNFTNSVAFVIENAPISAGINRDCVYIGTGLVKNTGDLTDDFIRLDLEKGEWQSISPPTYDAQDFTGLPRENAVAFTINGIGYVGLGNLKNGTPLKDFHKFDPSDRGNGHRFGKWTKIDDFPSGDRTKAVVFLLGDNAYVCCGEDKSGNKLKSVYMCRQTTGDWLTWSQREVFPGTGRIDAVAFNIGENGYVGTGLDDSGPTKDYYRYNPFLNIWEQRADFGGEARSEAVGQGIKISDSDYRGYIGGGWDAVPHPNSVYYNDYWHYRP